MASYQKVYLRVVGRIGDTPLDVDKFPDRVLAVGSAYLKPNIKDGYAENVLGPDGIEELEIPTPITLSIENGWLTYNGDPFVWLKVSEEGWNWNLSFPQLRINGTTKKLDEFNFALQPATTQQIANSELATNNPNYYWGVNLASLVEFPDPATGVKVSKGETGWSVVGVQRVGDDKFQFITNNPDVGSRNLTPVEIPEFTDLRENVMNAAAIAAAAAGIAGDHKDDTESFMQNAGVYATSAEQARAAAEGFKNTATTQAGIATTKAQEAAASAVAAGQAVIGQIPDGSLRHVKFAARDMSNLMPSGDLEVDILPDVDGSITFAYSYDTTRFYEGSRSIRLTGTTGTAIGKGIPTSPGEVFQFSLMQRADAQVTGPGGMRVQALVGSTWSDITAIKSLKSDISAVTTFGAFERAFMIAVMPAGATRVRWRLAYALTANPGFNYDDLDFRRIPEKLAPGSVDSGDIADATTTGKAVLVAASQAAARSAMGAGTSSLAIGTTATTAAAGNDSRLSDTRTPTAGSVVNAMVAAGAAIDPAKINGTAVITTDSRLSDKRTSPDNSVTSAQIVDGSILNADINNAAGIAISKLETGRVKAFNNGVAENLNIWYGTEAQYTAIGTKDPTTLYFRSA